MTSFKEQHEKLLDSVCRAMGNRWRVNQLTNRTDCVTLTSPEFKGLTLDVRKDYPHDDRLSISGHVPDHWSYRYCGKCTVSVNRPARQIAADIVRKVLPKARKWIEEANEYQAKKAAEREEKEQTKGLLQRLVNVSRGHQVLCCWDTNKINGSVDVNCYGTYRLMANALTKDEMIRIIGFISTLRTNDDRSNEQTDS
ncbi:hypothetical protein NFG91_001239 [Salmonella enterica]|nr:hypothetical protein [Salmonella enterica]EJI5360002.1 hypothetical protein [Salmonella enterica]